ncbi:MAG: reverse transcriptase domain-containing protein, partial [Alphaproteobacteria bacterium]
DVIASAESTHWKRAIDEEIESLNENDTFRYVKRSSLPADVNIMDYRWLFRVKLNSSGKVERYKARLVAKGFTQKEGIDYNETFAPVVKYKSLRIILALAYMLNYELKQMDVITAFLNAKLDEDVYMHVPEGFNSSKGDVLKLNKSLYGTKQAPHMWNDALNAFIVSIGFTRLASDTCVYVKRTVSGNMIVISIFVDDIVSAYASVDEREWLVVKKLFLSKYKMKDLGDVSWILGMKLTRDRVKGVLSLDQSLYLNKVLARFNMLDCKPLPTPESTLKLTMHQCPTTDEQKAKMVDVPYESAVGSLLYAAIGTRPDIAHAVNGISKFMKNPGQAHWLAAKRILRYIKGTVNKALVFTSKGITGNELYVSAYSDADWAGDIDDRRSTTGYVVRLGDSSVIWNTKKQKTISLSSAEAEYMALASVTQEVKWVNQFLCELLLPCMKLSLCMSVYVDNQAAILISKNDVYHDRTKHIDIRYHFIRNAIKSNLYKIEWVPTDKQLADGFTKPLSTITFTKLFASVMNQPP